jgi:lysophospholipase L1-like esterase
MLIISQFGHNDQKANSGVNLTQYATRLGDMADEVASAGAIPILVTPLTRRTFSGGKVIENLANETAITNRVAKEQSRHHIDLNKASTAYVNALGQAAADKYNLSPDDRTHLNEWGGVVFARIVSDLLVAAYPDEFKSVTVANATLSATIQAGKSA